MDCYTLGSAVAAPVSRVGGMIARHVSRLVPRRIGYAIHRIRHPLSRAAAHPGAPGPAVIHRIACKPAPGFLAGLGQRRRDRGNWRRGARQPHRIAQRSATHAHHRHAEHGDPRPNRPARPGHAALSGGDTGAQPASAQSQSNAGHAGTAAGQFFAAGADRRRSWNAAATCHQLGAAADSGAGTARLHDHGRGAAGHAPAAPARGRPDSILIRHFRKPARLPPPHPGIGSVGFQ